MKLFWLLMCVCMMTYTLNAQDTASTPTPLAEMSFVGVVQYQNRSTQDGIHVMLQAQGNLIAQVITDSSGAFNLTAPLTATTLIFDAPRHRRTVLAVNESMPALTIILPGGDLNADGCIGSLDIQLMMQSLTSQSLEGDINGDNVTDAADLAILSGNVEPACEAQLALLEVTAEVTAELMPEMTSTPVIELTVESTPDLLELTPELTPELTLEVTSELTPELLPSPTASLTPEVTIEPSPSMTVTSTPTLTPTPTASFTPTVTPTATYTPSSTPPAEVTASGTGTQ